MLLEDEGGSPRVFALFLAGNAVQGLSGLFTVASGCYVLRHEFEWMSAAFVMLGVGLLALAVLAFWSRKNADLLLSYVLGTAVLLGLQVAFTYAVVVRNEYDAILGQAQADQVRYVLVGCCALTFLCLLVGWWYRASLRSVLQAQLQDEDMRAGLQKVTQAARAPLL